MPKLVDKNSKNSVNFLALSKEDVDRLLHSETIEVRLEIIKKVADSHLNRKYSLSEVGIAEQILRIIAKDTELKIREMLADLLRHNPYIPRDIIIVLASDVTSVALPIISDSTILSEEDLLDIIATTKEIKKKLAISQRKNISKKISKALIDTKEETIIASLSDNITAEIDEIGYETIIANHTKNQQIIDSLANRPALPITIVEKIIALVSTALSDSLRKKYKIAAEAVEGESERTREIATLQLVDGDLNEKDVEKLVSQLHVFGRLTPSIILTSLCRGNLSFFEASLAKLSNIPLANAKRLIHDKGSLGFKALYAKAGLPEKFFAACKLLLEVVSEIRSSKEKIIGNKYSDLAVKNLLAKAGGQNIDNLSYIIAMIRQTN